MELKRQRKNSSYCKIRLLVPFITGYSRKFAKKKRKGIEFHCVLLRNIVSLKEISYH